MAEYLLDFKTVDNLQSKFPIRLPRSVFFHETIHVQLATLFSSPYRSVSKILLQYVVLCSLLLFCHGGTKLCLLIQCHFMDIKKMRYNSNSTETTNTAGWRSHPCNYRVLSPKFLASVCVYVCFKPELILHIVLQVWLHYPIGTNYPFFLCNCRFIVQCSNTSESSVKMSKF